MTVRRTRPAFARKSAAPVTQRPSTFAAQRAWLQAEGARKASSIWSLPSLPGLVSGRSLSILGLVLLGAVIFFTPFRPPLHAGAEQGALNYAGPIEGDYKLGPRDKIRVQVFEWRPARDEIFAWEALNAEYSVDVSGRLALPLIGQIPADGKTTGELAATISMLLQQRMGTVTAPDATVEIVEHRPFYVTGDVMTPGEYLFRPGLSVLQAVSLGGGLRRTNGVEGANFVRQMIQSDGDLSLLEQERISLLARHARLVAEVEGETSVKTPQELEKLGSNPTVLASMRNERLIFETRHRTFKKQLQTLDELKAHLEGETSSLTKQLTVADRRVGLLRKELTGIRRLSKKGLVTAPRLLGLERTLAELQGERLRLEARQSKVRSEIAQTEINKLDFIKRRSEDVTESLQKTMNELDQASRKTATGNRLLGHARLGAASDAANMQGDEKPKAEYAIVRKIGGRFIELAADEKTMVLPGDTLKVDLVLRSANPTAGGSGSNGQFFGTSNSGSSVPFIDTSPLKPIMYFDDAPANKPVVSRRAALAVDIDDDPVVEAEVIASNNGAIAEPKKPEVFSLPVPDEATVPVAPRIRAARQVVVPLPTRKQSLVLPAANPQRAAGRG